MELESSARLTEELASALDVQCQLRVRNQSLLRTIENQAHTIELLLTKQFQAANDIESLKSSAKSAQDDFEGIVSKDLAAASLNDISFRTSAHSR